MRELFLEGGEAIEMISDPMPSAIAEALRQSPYPMLALDLNRSAILGANDAACEFLERTPSSLHGVPIADLERTVHPPSQEAFNLLASGAIEGYRAIGHMQKPDGTEFTANLCARAATVDGTRFGLVSIESDPLGFAWPLLDPTIKVVLAMTDHDWTIEHVSSEAESILGRRTAIYKGFPLLGLLHPADVQSFMSAVGRLTAEGGSATLRTRVRLGEDRWRDVWCLVVAMCQHSPPRLGLVITTIPELDVELNLERDHRRLAVIGDDVLGGMDHLRSRIPSGSFSTRQWEILVRLVRGERTKDIAAALYLSPSTVRNHLTAIYKKFGVHSQTELLAELLETLG